MSEQGITIGLVLLPRFNMFTLATMIEPMRIANYLVHDELYTWEYVATEGGTVVASNGMQQRCRHLENCLDESFDLIAVFGSWGAENFDDNALTNWIRVQARKGVAMIGVELGVYALARAGVLAGKQATTHWSWKQGFAESFPNVEVCEQLYTLDHKIMTCGGGTAGLDLMLQLIADLNGEQLAIEITNQILHNPRRAPTSPQRHAAGSLAKDIHPDVREAMRLMEINIEEPLKVPQLCNKLNVSQRSLERLFIRDTGCTVVQFSKLLRLQYARVLLISTRMSVREVSVACGFNSLSYFSQCFSAMFAKRPSEYRQAWPENEPTPSWPGTVYSFIHDIKDTTGSSLA